MKNTKTQEFNWQEKYRDRITTAATAVKLINSGHTVFIGSGCAQPNHLVSAMVDRGRELVDVHVIHILTMGPVPYLAEKLHEKFKVNTFFIGENVRGEVSVGHAEYTPIHLSDLPHEFDEGRIPVDVALIMVSPPDQRGQCSFGVSVDVVKSAAAGARYVIAQVNPNMPRTLGDAFIHVNQIDYLVPCEEPLFEAPAPKLEDTLCRIGENVARLIEDGSTIQCGIGAIPQAVAEYLGNKKDLGIHTEMFSDWVMDLIDKKVINCKKKSVNRGKVVASFCMGSKKLYEYVDDNPFFEFHPTEYVNDPYVVGQHDKMVAINSGLEIDLTGQVCADSLGSEFYSGFGGQVDFGRGAARSRGGKSIIALPSTAKGDAVSRIVPSLSAGAGVVTSRADVHYVVTEYGVAYLHGKSIRERALALINIAHPKFRSGLLQAAKTQKLVYEDQMEMAWEKVRYPEELERFETLRDGSQVFLRPVKPTDEPKISEMLYSLSADSVHKRFFTYTMSFPHRNVQQFANIDYQQNLSIVGVVPGPVEEEVVAIAQYFLDPRTGAAEVAFVVQDDWQARGMGTLLMQHLSVAAVARGVKRLYAKVIAQNKPMIAVFQNCGLPTKMDTDGDTYSFTFELQKK